ncbi:MAG: polyamine aminopropyltransferase [Alphaproteobacteria bacterium]
MNWFDEDVSVSAKLRLGVERWICEDQTRYQKVQIFENGTFGRVLVLDGIIQTTERDEFIYHEMIAHPPILAHGGARRVLIIGGGDGGALEEVLKQPVEKVTLVEIDARVIELCREHLPSIGKGAFDDPRTELIIGDGAAFVAETNERFNVIIVDSTDAAAGGPGYVLYESDFYTDCRRCLAPDGIFVSQNSVPFFPAEAEELKKACPRMREVFPDMTLYVAPVPSYEGGFMVFGWAGFSTEPREVPLETIRQRFEAVRLDTKYYNPAIHLAAFALPTYIQEMMA